MHYCIIVITEQFPTDDILDQKLRPFSDDTFYGQFPDDEEIPEDAVRPQFTWDWWTVGGRYGGLLKLKIDEADEEYNWMYVAKEPRAGRLFRSDILEQINNKKPWFCHDEERAFLYMGSREGYIHVDGCKIKDVIDFEDTVVNHGWGFIGKNGEAYSREYWTGKKYIKDELYEEKVKAAIQNVEDCYVCYVDIHD